MDLIEREECLDVLQSQFEKISEGEGHCIFVSGEAGIGKTSLIRAFCKKIKNNCNIYQGTCDALFAPRPLAPLYDVMMQMRHDLPGSNEDITDRTSFFSKLFYELKKQEQRSIVVFEDIHWADEATLDFIKFLARRITQLETLFILTYRDDEINTKHALRNILGQLSPDSFTRLQLLPLSKEAVKNMAKEKGYKSEDVYSISGGNPFYVNEILASYSKGVPDNIRDSVLSTYNRVDGKTKQIWEILSVLPTAFEVSYLEKMEPYYAFAIDSCLTLKILIINNGLISFKHELFRRTIESSLSPLVRVSLHKKILDLFKESFEAHNETERIIHHAKNANEYDLVVHYAPIAAKQAVCVGAHIEASKLYLSAIDYYQGNDKDILIGFYESYAYECYLTNQIKEAIIYTTKSLEIRQEKNDIEKTANCMRLLSRLWWLDRNRKNAEKFAEKAIEILEDRPASATKAMVFSNMAQLKMLCDRSEESLAWGEKAILIAKEINDDESLSHALNNVGSIQMNIAATEHKGLELLQQSLTIAVKNSFHEHAARAYSNIGSNGVKMKKYSFAKAILDEGIEYCEERDLDSWRSNMLSLKAVLQLETGNWDEAYNIANTLLGSENNSPSFIIHALLVAGKIKLRRGEADAPDFLLKAEIKAFETMEMQRIIPSLTGLLEYEWLNGKSVIKTEHLDHAINLIHNSINNIENSEFAFWLLKARGFELQLNNQFEGYNAGNIQSARKAAAIWEKTGCPYEQALALFEGDEEDKRKAIIIIQNTGALAVYEKLKFYMRTTGIKSIPRGIRKSTRLNPANLTERELDVLQLLKEGLQNKEIADKLFISPKTVDHHISSIFFKLEVNSRGSAVQVSIREGIIK